MKLVYIYTLILGSGALLAACGGKGRSEGRAYMPDMAYSRAYETYSSTENLKEKGINYTAMPVPGTIARGDSAAYIPSMTDTVGGYANSVQYTNPYSTLTSQQMAEAERLYMVNCAVCHGGELNGNGPLYKDGTGPFPVMPRNLVDEYSKALADGQMYFVMTVGKGAMGSYASQISPEQRWMIVSYIRKRQSGGSGTTTDTTGAASTDTTAAQ